MYVLAINFLVINVKIAQCAFIYLVTLYSLYYQEDMYCVFLLYCVGNKNWFEFNWIENKSLYLFVAEKKKKH